MVPTLSLYDFKNKIGQNSTYTRPSEENIVNIKKLAECIILYEENWSSNNISNLREVLSKLKMTYCKIAEMQNTLCFYPIDKGQSVIFWNLNPINFGTVDQSPPTLTPTLTPTSSPSITYPFILSYQHCGTDSVNNISFAYFLNNKYKALVINGIYACKSKLPSVYQKLRSASDGCHSPDLLNNYFMDHVINNLYQKKLGLLSLHGMSSNHDFNMWFLNSMGNKGYDVSKRSFPLLLAISLALADFDYPVMMNQLFDQHYVIKNGIKQYLSGPEGVFEVLFGPTSDVPMHIINDESISPKVGKDRGRAVHIEHAITWANKPNTIKLLNEIHEKALNWYIKWDNDIHKFENIPKDLAMFEKWLNNQ